MNNPAGDELSKHNASLRSIPLDIANPIVNALAKCRPLDVHVYMENGAPSLFPLDQPFTLHDGVGVDDLDDLRLMASADVRISALGGYVDLIHWGARHGLSILPYIDPNNFIAPSFTRTNHKRITLAYQWEMLNSSNVCQILSRALE